MKNTLLKQSSFLITGSNGFIGNNLFDFLKKDHIVYRLDRDILKNPAILNRYISTIQPDYVIHLAAYGNHSIHKDINEMVSTNILDTYTLLSCCKDIPLKGFINVGSSSEYGKKTTSMHEDDNLETNTFYGATKVASTYISRAFAKQYNMPVVTVRPFSVYGPGEADFRFIPSLIYSIINNSSYTLAPEPNHDWIYIQDFMNGVIKVIENINDLKGEVVNIGTAKQYPNIDVAKLLEKISGKALSIDCFANLRTYDNTYWVSNNSLLKSLGWKQQFTLEQGLKTTYEYYEKRFKKKNN